MPRRRVPPGLVRVLVAGAGALAAAGGTVALLNGRAVGAVLAAGGALLLGWSALTPRA